MIVSNGPYLLSSALCPACRFSVLAFETFLPMYTVRCSLVRFGGWVSLLFEGAARLARGSVEHGETQSVNQLLSRESPANVSQDAVLFLDHVVVGVDGPLTVTLMLSSSYLLVRCVTSNLKVAAIGPFFIVFLGVFWVQDGARSCPLCSKRRGSNGDCCKCNRIPSDQHFRAAAQR